MSDKENLIARIWATIRKRDIIKQLLLDNNDNFNPAARVLMAELSRFCYGNKTPVKVSKVTGTIDPIALAVAAGRREVLLRIMEILGFSDANALKMIEQLNQQEE